LVRQASRSCPPAPDENKGFPFGEVRQPDTTVDHSITSSRDHYALTIDLPAIAANVNAIRRRLNEGREPGERKILAVLKNDAYGLGLRDVAVFLGGESKVGPLVEWIGVGTVAEASGLLGERLAARILIMDGVSADEAKQVVKNDWTPIVWDEKSIEFLSREAERQEKRVRVHIKVDTGLTRLGVSPSDLPVLLDSARGHRRVVVDGVCSHLAHPSDAATGQIKVFDAAVALCKKVLEQR